MKIISSTTFDDELKKIKFFKEHEYLLPFVGEKYQEGGILHIGASYYFQLDEIDHAQKQEAECVLNEWWDESQEARKRRVKFLDTYRKPLIGNDLSKFGDYVNARKIVECFCNDNAYKEEKRAIYREFLMAAYDKQSSEDLKDTEGYAPFAYMNFFQKPAQGVQTWYDDTSARNSCVIVKEVIKVLKPKIIIFTSGRAYDAFINNINNLTYPHIAIMRFPHPTSPWWNRTQKWRDSWGIAPEQSTAKARLTKIFKILRETR